MTLLSGRLRGFLFATLMALCLSASVGAREVSVILLLDGNFLADWQVRTSRDGARPEFIAKEAAGQLAQIQSRQAALETRLNSLVARVTARISRVGNALAVRASDEQLPKMMVLQGVLHVQSERTYALTLATSVRFVSAPAAWSPTAGGLARRGTPCSPAKAADAPATPGWPSRNAV